MFGPFDWQWIFILLILAVLILLLFHKVQNWGFKRESLNPASPVSDLIFYKHQLNPHFVYNSLNAIKLLIQQTQNEQAVDYLVDFSKLLRKLQNQVDKSLISMEEEIETSRLFLSIQKLRLRGKFNFSIESEDRNLEKQLLVPPMILKPFLEQAISRIQLSERASNHLFIKLNAIDDHLLLTLEDDGVSHQIQRDLWASKKQKTAEPNRTQNNWHALASSDWFAKQVKCYDKMDENGAITEIYFPI